MALVKKRITPKSIGIQSTLGHLMTAMPALERLAESRLPVQTAYTLAKLCRLVQIETEYFQTQRANLFKEYGVERPSTDAEKATCGASVFEVQPDNIDVFRVKLNELLALPVSIDWTPISVTALGSLEMSAADFIALGAFVVDADAHRGEATP